jgi:hypothetical protein
MKYTRVEDVKQPLQKGHLYLVPCIVRDAYGKKEYITPVINHPHNDAENGQKEIHYHVDYRFVKLEKEGVIGSVKRGHSKHSFVDRFRPEKGVDGELVYIVLPVINEDFMGITPKAFIKNSKLKHNCIHKGKCPHRGYDLSQVSSKDGVITCPLHGLQFDAETNKLINT